MSQLLETGKCNVTVFDIRSFGDSRVKCIVGDLRKLEDVTKACAGNQFYQANQMSMQSSCRGGIAWNGSDAKGKDNSYVAMALCKVLSCPKTVVAVLFYAAAIQCWLTLCTAVCSVAPILHSDLLLSVYCVRT